MAKTKSDIERGEEILAELRATITEAREARKDLLSVIKEIPALINGGIGDRINATGDRFIAELVHQFTRIQEETEFKYTRRIEQLINSMLGKADTPDDLGPHIAAGINLMRAHVAGQTGVIANHAVPVTVANPDKVIERIIQRHAGAGPVSQQDKASVAWELAIEGRQ